MTPWTGDIFSLDATFPPAGADWNQVRRLARFEGVLSDQRIPYPLVPAVAGFDPAAEVLLATGLRGVLDAVDTVARTYATDRELRQFLNLPPLLHELSLVEPPRRRHVDYCRFDLCGDRTDTVRILEVNGCFAGMSSTCGRLSRYWRRTPAVGQLAARYPSAGIEDPGWLVSGLLGLCAERGVEVDPREPISLLCASEAQALTETFLIEQQVRDHGRRALLVAADEPEATTAHVGMLMYPNRPFVEEPERYAHVLTRVADDRIITFNGIRGRAVGDNKLTLAVLSDPRFRRLFTDAQIGHLDALVPWSRKLGDGVTATHAVSYRADLVLKSPCDALSRGVHIGREQNPAEWRALVENGAKAGWLVQEFVPPQRVLLGDYQCHRTFGATFVSGRPVGYTAWLSTSLTQLPGPVGGAHAVFGSRAGHP